MSKSSKEESEYLSSQFLVSSLFFPYFFLHYVSFLQINIDPESLKPKLPSRKDLRPYPNSCYLEYKGHTGAVTSISTDSSGEWIASGISLFFFFFNEVSFVFKMLILYSFFLQRFN